MIFAGDKILSFFYMYVFDETNYGIVWSVHLSVFVVVWAIS